MQKKIGKQKVFSPVVDEVAACFGGIPHLAAALKCTRHAIYLWSTTGIPDGRLFELEVITHGKLKAMDLLKKQNNLRKLKT